MFATASSVLGGLERAIEDAQASELRLDLPRLRALIDRLDALWLQQVRAAERAGELHHLRAGPAKVLADRARLGLRQAARDLQASRALEELPALAAAHSAGRVPAHHVRLVTDACTPERAAVFADLDERFAEWAAGRGTWRLRAVVHRVREVADGDRGAGVANERYERRRLHVSASFGRVGFVDGQLDPEGAEIVISALEHRMEDDRDRCAEAGDKRRTRPQRRADALVDICRLYLARADDHDAHRTGRRRGRPHAGISVDLELLRADGHLEIVDAIRGDLAHVGAVSAETLRRLTCDAGIHRVLTGGRSEVLDVGRATRTVPTALWRALVARDRRCQAPGCDRPPGWCEAHHIVHWADGGPTRLDNLELVCWRHHRDHHEGHARAGP